MDLKIAAHAALGFLGILVVLLILLQTLQARSHARHLRNTPWLPEDPSSLPLQKLEKRLFRTLWFCLVVCLLLWANSTWCLQAGTRIASLSHTLACLDLAFLMYAHYRLGWTGRKITGGILIAGLAMLASYWSHPWG